MRKILFCSLLLFAGLRLGAQMQIDFVAGYGNMLLRLDSAEATGLRVTDLQFYLSDIRLLRRGKVVWRDSTARLVDWREAQRCQIRLDCPNGLRFDAIEIGFGVDSLTNVSGALGGDLDPTLGMYWAWHSGYINFKLEGQAPQCKTRKNAFQYHIGGYAPPFATYQRRLFRAKSRKLQLKLDIEALINALDLANVPEIMSPSERAASLAPKIAQLFQLNSIK